MLIIVEHPGLQFTAISMRNELVSSSQAVTPDSNGTCTCQRHIKMMLSVIG